MDIVRYIRPTRIEEGGFRDGVTIDKGDGAVKTRQTRRNLYGPCVWDVGTVTDEGEGSRENRVHRGTECKSRRNLETSLQ